MRPGVIIKLLANFFGTSEEAPTKDEFIVFHQIKSNLQEEYITVDEYTTLIFDDAASEASMDDDFGDDTLVADEPSEAISGIASSSSCSTYVPSPPQISTFPEGYLADAYRLWTKQPRKGFKSDELPQLCLPGKSIDSSPRVPFSTVMSRKKRIKNKSVMKRFEKSLKSAGSSKRYLQKAINLEVLKCFLEARNSSTIIHDRTLRIWAMDVKKKLDPENVLSFCASKSWVKKFKLKNKIVSRKITHKVSKKWTDINDTVQNQANEFANSIISLISEEHLCDYEVFNADQSRFEKELHSDRTLAIKGSKQVFGRVGSVAATTHSYMIMPVLVMNGTLLPHMYVLVSEPSGRFPVHTAIDYPNIKAFAGKTANMSKQDLKVFLDEVLWPDLVGRENVLLLVDSWTSNKDDDLYKSTVPKNVKFIKRLIPAKCTGIVQPADVYFFRPYKNFVRFLTDTLLIAKDNVNIWHRDYFLRIQSFAHYQFSAKRFENLIRFAFFKCGYIVNHPGPFDTPIDYCCERIQSDEYTETDCEQTAFIRCAHCEKVFCIDHTLIKRLHTFCK